MRTEDGYIIHKCLNGDPAAFGLLVDKYKGSIYALAYSKLGNFHDAEDVTQEVFIKAFQKLRALRRWDSFHAWLYAITANLCKQWTRSQSKRPDRAVVSDQEPGVLRRISADSAVNSHRDELVYASVSEALESLPEKYRQILALHYLGGMTYSEMSRFLGVSISTITKRLKTARDRLKAEMMSTMTEMYAHERLDADFTLHIMGILQGIKPIPVPRAQWLPWGISLATGLIIAVLGLSSNFILLDHSSASYEYTVLNEGRAELLPRDLHTSETSTSRHRRNGEAFIYVDVPVTLMAASEKMAGASSMNLRQGRSDQAENRPLTAAISHSKERTVISGKVMRGDVHVPNAHVYIYGQNAKMKWETITQTDGSFEMEIPKPDDAILERLTAVAQHPGYSLGWTKLSRDNAVNATIRLRQPIAVSGMIQDRHGTPIQGVDVRVSMVTSSGPGVPGGDRLAENNIPIPAVKTGVDGAFVHNNLPGGSGVALHISKTGYAEQRKYSIAVGTKGLLFKLAPEGRIQGRVTYDGTQEPVAEVEIRAEGIGPTTGHVYSQTDEEGRYSVANLSAGEYNVRITGLSSSEWAATGLGHVEVFEGQVTEDIDLKLVEAGFITGRVTDRNTDEPIRNCLMRVQSSQALPSFTYTDEDGRYRFQVVPGKTYMSPIAPAGYRIVDPAERYVDVVMGETVSDTHFQLQEVPQLSVTGRTVSSVGEPIAGAVITDRLQRHKIHAISDRDGVFTISRLQSGQRLVVEANHAESQSRGYADVEVRPGLEVKILMGERYKVTSVSGRVVDGQGMGIPSANISLLRFDKYLARNIQSELQVYAGMTDASGTYGIPELIVGDEYMVRARAEGYVDAEAYVFTATEDMSQLRDITLLHSGDFFLQGRVVNSDGAPLVGTRILARSVNGRTETNENGHYRLHKLPFAVEMQVDVIHPGYGHHVFRYVPTNHTQDFVIIEGERKLAGKVMDANGDPVVGVSVSAQRYVDKASVHISMATLTSHRGEFQLDNLLYERESIRISSHELGLYRVFEDVETNREDTVFILAEEVSKDRERAGISLKELMGKPAPELDVAQWIYGEPVTLAELRGKVIVLHFWKSTDFSSVEAIRLLNALKEEYSQRGLVCIGIHEFTPQVNGLRKLIGEKEVAYRIAVDKQWPSTASANGITFAKYASGGSFILIDRMGIVHGSVWDHRLETTIWKLLSD